jgi:hypothetical protein
LLVLFVLANVGCGHARPADLQAIGELLAANDALRTYRTTCGAEGAFAAQAADAAVTPQRASA